MTNRYFFTACRKLRSCCCPRAFKRPIVVETYGISFLSQGFVAAKLLICITRQLPTAVQHSAAVLGQATTPTKVLYPRCGKVQHLRDFSRETLLVKRFSEESYSCAHKIFQGDRRSARPVVLLSCCASRIVKSDFIWLPAAGQEMPLPSLNPATGAGCGESCVRVPPFQDGKKISTSKVQKFNA